MAIQITIAEVNNRHEAAVVEVRSDDGAHLLRHRLGYGFEGDCRADGGFAAMRHIGRGQWKCKCGVWEETIECWFGEARVKGLWLTATAAELADAARARDAAFATA